MKTYVRYFLWYVALWLVAFLFWAMAAVLFPSICQADDSKSAYVPMCIETNCPPQTRNTVTIMTGPSVLQVAGKPNEELFTFGYLRRITGELSLGVQVLGTDRRYLGSQFGFGYNF